MARPLQSKNVKPAASLTAKRKFSEVPIATLIVGEQRKKFHVHLDLLCDASPFFKAAFRGKFKENAEKTMQLPEDQECTVELFVDWLYHQRYEMLPGASYHPKSDITDEDREKDVTKYLEAFRFFVFADKYNVDQLKNDVIKTLVTDSNEWFPPPLSTVAYAYEHTAQGSGLRRLLADVYACGGNLKDFYEFPEEQAVLRQVPDFAVDIIASLAKNVKGVQREVFFEGGTPKAYKDMSLARKD